MREILFKAKRKDNGKWDDEDCVIAWMYLPEPYKED